LISTDLNMLPGEAFSGSAFNRALAQCEGDLSLSLANTWTSLTLNGGFIVLSIISLIALFCKRFTVWAPRSLLISKLVRWTHPSHLRRFSLAI
jgi:hypothetical protein